MRHHPFVRGDCGGSQHGESYFKINSDFVIRVGQILAESGSCVPSYGEARGKRMGGCGAMGNRGLAKMEGAPALPQARGASPSWECSSVSCSPGRFAGRFYAVGPERSFVPTRRLGTNGSLLFVGADGWFKMPESC